MKPAACPTCGATSFATREPSGGWCADGWHIWTLEEACPQAYAEPQNPLSDVPTDILAAEIRRRFDWRVPLGASSPSPERAAAVDLAVMHAVPSLLRRARARGMAVIETNPKRQAALMGSVRRAWRELGLTG